MFETILIAIDSSENSNRALAAGAEIANRFDSSVVVLHASAQARSMLEIRLIGSDDMLRVLEKFGNQVLEKARQLLWRHGVGGAKLVYAQEKPVAAILQACRDYQVDLVVMGSRGLGDISAAVMGSVSTRVAHRAPCPVLIVR